MLSQAWASKGRAGQGLTHVVTVTPCLMIIARIEWMHAEGSEFRRNIPSAYCATVDSACFLSFPYVCPEPVLANAHLCLRNLKENASLAPGTPCATDSRRSAARKDPE